MFKKIFLGLVIISFSNCTTQAAPRQRLDQKRTIKKKKKKGLGVFIKKMKMP